MKREQHTIMPLYDQDSQILILGSFPSVKSRESRFYYGHPQNRFWKVLAEVLDGPLPGTVEEKKALLGRYHIALWDVIESCEISGSSDSSITNVIPNDISSILKKTRIKAVYVNGGKAYELLNKYNDITKFPPVYKMPSTSPANARFRLENLISEWKIIRETLEANN